MSEFSFVKDPIRNTTFALVVKSGEDAEIYAFSERAKSWANSQFGIDITPPDGMVMSAYRSVTPEIESTIQKVDVQANGVLDAVYSLQKITSPKYAHQKRVSIKSSSKSSSIGIKKFSKTSKNSVIDFKAKKFMMLKKRSSLATESNGMKSITDTIISRFGPGTVRRAMTSANEAIMNGAKTKRAARRVKSIAQHDESYSSIELRIVDSMIDKEKGFRFQ